MFRKFLRKRSRSILFINPDYHCTFVYKEELEKLGWKADILVPSSFPQKYLYKRSEIKISRARLEFLKKNGLDDLLLFISIFFKYKYHFYYGRPPLFRLSSRFSEIFFKEEAWNAFFFLSKLFHSKIIYLPSGCRDEFNRKEFSLFDNGRVCKNCAFYNFCDEEANNLNLRIVKKYADLCVGAGFFDTPFLTLVPMKWKSIDLEKWKPNIEIPTKFALPHYDGVTIVHCPPGGLRDSDQVNIKGSIYLRKAINNLVAKGYQVRLVEIENLNIDEVIFIQAQADIVVDQLIYGQWGSFGIEGLALGKPTICYMRTEWKTRFLYHFGEYKDLPIIDADIDTIGEVLLNLLLHPDSLKSYGIQSRIFAEQHFNPKNNAKNFVEIIEKL